jgi:NitT/TauT family transport system substrate-binding protein
MVEVRDVRSTRRSFIGKSAGTLAAVSGASGVLAACGSPAAQKGAATQAAHNGTVQVVNILPPQLGYAAEYIADMDGFFKKEGLTVKVATARGSAPAIQAILSGTALLSWVGWLESVIDIANKSAPIQSVAFTGRRSTLAIVSDKSKKPLAQPQNLVGNRIGIPSAGGTSETTLDLMLASNNIPANKVPRQVTGFTPGTFELIKKGRIAGFVIGASQEEQFREAQPDSMFLNTDKYVTDGLTYITSAKGLSASKDQIKAYMRALKGSMEQILEDRKAGFPNTIKKLRTKYDFAELKKDSVAKAYLEFNVGSWVVDGQDKLLQTDPEKWKATYDAAVKVKAAKAGVDVTKNVASGIVA